MKIKRVEAIGDVKGEGLFLNIEIVEPQENKWPALKRTAELLPECEDRCLLLGSGISIGSLGTNTIRLCPPVVITDEQKSTVLSTLEDVLPTI